jgi:hypothetical protein
VRGWAPLGSPHLLGHRPWATLGVRPWAEMWFSTVLSSLNCAVRDAWDVTNLRCTFHRIVDNRLMQQWYEILQIADSIQFGDENDAIIWKFNSTGKYSVQSLYAVINDRGVKHVYTPVMWKLSVPPRLHIFL